MEMRFPRNSLIFLARILAIILYEELQREIGLNLPKDLGFTSFRIRARKVELMPPPTLDFFQKSFYHSQQISFDDVPVYFIEVD